METPNRQDRYNYFRVLIAAGVLYAVSCAPGALWQDSGMIQYRVWHNDIVGGFGLALAHPLFYIIAIGVKSLPIGEFAHRVNLVSSLAGAVAVANLFLLVRLWRGSRFAGFAAALTFALSHTFWRHASIAETYTMYLAFFTAGLVMLLQWHRTRRPFYILLLGLFNGLGVAVHLFGVIPLACYAIYLVFEAAKGKLKWRFLFGFAGCWIVGALPYLCLVAGYLAETGDLGATVSTALFGDRWQGAVLNTSFSGRIMKENILFFGLNFPTPNLLLIFVGLWAILQRAKDKVFRNIFLVIMVLFLAFAARYTVPDRYAFFLPFYCMAAALVGAGGEFLCQRLRTERIKALVVVAAVLGPVIYAFLPLMAEQGQVNLGTGRTVPCRNDYKYFLQPWKTGYDGAERFAQQALESAGPDGIIYADGTTVYPLLYVQEVNEIGCGVTVVTGHGTANNLEQYNKDDIDELAKKRAIYVVTAKEGYCPDFLLERFEFEKVAVIYKLKLTDFRPRGVFPGGE